MPGEPVDGVAPGLLGHFKLLCFPLVDPFPTLRAVGPRKQDLTCTFRRLRVSVELLDVRHAADFEGPQARADLGDDRAGAAAGDLELLSGGIRHARKSTGE